jgi:drug/metabolite transporter (DMT)-like permease
LAFVVLVWGFSPTLFKLVLAELQPLTFVFLRFVLLSLLSIGVLAWRSRHGRRAWSIGRADIALLIVSGLSGYGIYQLFYMVGLSHTTVFASALAASTVPLWSALLLASLRVEHIHPAQWVGILVSFGGVALFLLTARNHQSEAALGHTLAPAEVLLGNVLSFGGAALFALYGVTNKKLATRYSAPELMCYTLIIGTLALAPFGIPAILSQNWSRVTWHTWAILPYSVIFPIYLTYSIWNWAIGVRGVGYVTLYSYAVPVLGGIVGFLILGETLAPAQVAAGAVVIGGMLVARWGATRNSRAASTPQIRARAVYTEPQDSPLDAGSGQDGAAQPRDLGAGPPTSRAHLPIS